MRPIDADELKTAFPCGESIRTECVRATIDNMATIMPSAQSERLTDDDLETIRIHLSAYKEQLCNQHRWEEAEDYQRIIDRLVSFASAQPERKTGRWCLQTEYPKVSYYKCSVCGRSVSDDTGYDVTKDYPFCHCGADMRGE